MIDYLATFMVGLLIGAYIGRDYEPLEEAPEKSSILKAMEMEQVARSRSDI